MSKVLIKKSGLIKNILFVKRVTKLNNYKFIFKHLASNKVITKNIFSLYFKFTLQWLGFNVKSSQHLKDISIVFEMLKQIFLKNNINIIFFFVLYLLKNSFSLNKKSIFKELKLNNSYTWVRTNKDMFVLHIIYILKRLNIIINFNLYKFLR